MTKYGAILIDPPWKFLTWRQTSFGSPNGVNGRSAARYYPLMELQEIYALPVRDFAAPDCALFMWSINSMIPHAMKALDAWGFEFKTVAFTWAKRTITDAAWFMGMGYWSRQNTEQCFLATRGNPKPLARDVRQLIVEPRRQHSRKPDRIYRDIERLVAGPYLEMFARQRWPGWDAWGNETEKFDGQAAVEDRREPLLPFLTSS